MKGSLPTLQLYTDEPDNVPSLEGFISDDHKHIVRWERLEEDQPPGWVCTSHGKPYYDLINGCMADEQTSD